MINNKCSYYKFLEKEKINVVPTFLLSSETSSKEGLQKVVDKLFEKVKYNGWKKFIAKPVYGQESSDFRKFTPNNTLSVKNILLMHLKNTLVSYFKNILKVLTRKIQNIECTL